MKRFYADGLHFSCAQCSHCCRDFPGVVLLSKRDMARLCEWANLTEEQFIQVYCRWVKDEKGKEWLSLREKQNYDCILWENGGCTAYTARPVQCSTYPFWTSVLKSKKAWKERAKECPGIDKGTLHSAEEIEEALLRYELREAITRES